MNRSVSSFSMFFSAASLALTWEIVMVTGRSSRVIDRPSRFLKNTVLIRTALAAAGFWTADGAVTGNFSDGGATAPLRSYGGGGSTLRAK